MKLRNNGVLQRTMISFYVGDLFSVRYFVCIETNVFLSHVPLVKELCNMKEVPVPVSADFTE